MDIEFIPFEDESQYAVMLPLIEKDLSEPYSVFTYRYFTHPWPHLSFLAIAYPQTTIEQTLDQMDLNAPKITGIRSGGKCVGTIVCKVDAHRHWEGIKRGYIGMLAVDETYRKLKIGSTLVHMAVCALKKEDVHEIVLETEYKNKAALAFYEKLGFVRDKRLAKYYLNGGDAFRLKLWISSDYPKPREFVQTDEYI